MRTYTKADLENMTQENLVRVVVELQNALVRQTELRRDAERKLREMEIVNDGLEDTVRMLRYRAEHEPVTGLLRNEVVEREILATINALDEEEKKRTCILYFDIDEFKLINDTYGHNEGDAVLKRVAGEITATIKRGDFAGRGDAGDEFIVFLRDSSEQEAIEIGELISLKVSRQKYFALDNRGQRTGYRTTVSFGVAPYPGDIPLDEWKCISDQDMYRRKRMKKQAT
jgi:diguanylate cyclase (GGDEF)-like protein